MRLTPEQLERHRKDPVRTSDLLDTIDALTVELASAREREKAEVIKQILDKKRDLYEIGSRESEAIQFVVNLLNIRKEPPCGTAENATTSTSVDTHRTVKDVLPSDGLHLPEGEWNHLTEESKAKVTKWFDLATEHLQDILDEKEKAGEAAAYRKAADEIITSQSAVGAWLDSPKAVAAAILALISPSAQSALDSMIAELKAQTAAILEKVVVQLDYDISCYDENEGAQRIALQISRDKICALIPTDYAEALDEYIREQVEFEFSQWETEIRHIGLTTHTNRRKELIDAALAEHDKQMVRHLAANKYWQKAIADRVQRAVREEAEWWMENSLPYSTESGRRQAERLAAHRAACGTPFPADAKDQSRKE